MQRRNILKQIGVIAGVGSLGVSDVEVGHAKETDELIERKIVYGEMTFEVIESEVKLPKVSSCVKYSQYTTKEKNKNKIFVNLGKDHPADLKNSAELIGTHSGIVSGSNESVDFEKTPASAFLTGNYNMVVGSDSQKVEINTMDKHTLEISMGEAEIDLQKDQSGTDSFTSEIKFGRDSNESAEVTIQLDARHWGKVKMIGHTDHYVFEKSAGMKKVLDKIKKDRDSDSKKEEKKKVKIKEHDNAYELIPSWSDHSA